MSYSVQMPTLNLNCGHNHETVDAALHCRKVQTELSNKSLLRGAKLRPMWETANVIDNTTKVAVPLPEWNPVANPKTGKISN